MRVVIADDAALIREGVARLLTENGLDVVGQVGDADALLTSVRDARPDVALVDIRMPPTRGRRQPRTRGQNLGLALGLSLRRASHQLAGPGARPML